MASLKALKRAFTKRTAIHGCIEPDSAAWMRLGASPMCRSDNFVAPEQCSTQQLLQLTN